MIFQNFPFWWNQKNKEKIDKTWYFYVRVYFFHSIFSCIFCLEIDFYPSFQSNYISNSLIRFWILKNNSILEIQFLEAKIFFLKSNFQWKVRNSFYFKFEEYISIWKHLLIELTPSISQCIYSSFIFIILILRLTSNVLILQYVNLLT